MDARQRVEGVHRPNEQLHLVLRHVQLGLNIALLFDCSCASNDRIENRRQSIQSLCVSLELQCQVRVQRDTDVLCSFGLVLDSLCGVGQ